MGSYRFDAIEFGVPFVHRHRHKRLNLCAPSHHRSTSIDVQSAIDPKIATGRATLRPPRGA
jgi:hypothetical protein